MALSSQDVLSDRFQSALLYALRLHAGQQRKNKQIPYYAHLLSVTALVIEAGGDEEEAIAALLHDAVEDQGGYARLEEIKSKFGKRVADIVDGCTDAYQMPKPPWKERKERYLHDLNSASASVILVSLADKVHNARSIYRDLKRAGKGIWESFNGGKDGTLWYYRSLAKTFLKYEERYPALVQELQDLVDSIHHLARELE